MGIVGYFSNININQEDQMKLPNFLGKPLEKLTLEEVIKIVRVEEVKFILFSKPPKQDK